MIGQSCLWYTSISAHACIPFFPPLFHVWLSPPKATILSYSFSYLFSPLAPLHPTDTIIHAYSSFSFSLIFFFFLLLSSCVQRTERDREMREFKSYWESSQLLLHQQITSSRPKDSENWTRERSCQGRRCRSGEWEMIQTVRERETREVERREKESIDYPR